MKENNDTISSWSNTHVFYNMYLHKPLSNSAAERREYFWKKRLVSETPNGKLITQNSFFNTLRNSDKIFLAHITYNLNNILRGGTIFSSGGCLTGSIYCTPLTTDKLGLRMHNLGTYVFKTEAPMMAKKHNQQPDILIFEIETNKNNHRNLIGIDYLRAGKIHYSIYKQLEYLLSYRERSDLYQIIVSRAKQSLEYLALCDCFSSKKNINPDYFLDIFIKNIPYLPILGYLYFEAISEYLMLFQNSEQAKKYIEIEEFYNHSYKKLMYDLLPKLKQNFKLSDFYPSIKKVTTYLEEGHFFTNFNSNHFKNWLTERLIYLTNARLLDNYNKNQQIDWREINWSFENLAKYTKPLLGHLIHRELRNFGRYPSFYFYFDQTKALQAWNYWNHMDIEIPFNGIIPKGEVGINPALPDLKYKVYHGRYLFSNKSGFSYVRPVKQLKINIEPKLIDLRYSTMHARPKLKYKNFPKIKNYNKI